MRRSVSVIAIGILLVSLAGGSALATAPSDGAPPETANEVAPGERLSGSIGVQNAELGGTLTEHQFGIAIAAATSNSSKASTLAAQLDSMETRIDELEEQRTEIDQLHEEEQLTHGQYVAHIAIIEAERTITERLVNQSIDVAQQVSDSTLHERGVDRERLTTLRDRAGELNGPEVSEIAKDIAGSSIGDLVPDSVGDVLERDRTDSR